MCLFSVGFISQWWMRTRYPRWFNKYNYILAAALDGGTQVRFYKHILTTGIWGMFTDSHGWGRSWFSSFRLLFKEPLGSLSCSRNGEENTPSFSILLLVIHIDVEFFFLLYNRWGANQAGWSKWIFQLFCNKYTKKNQKINYRELW